MFRPILVVSALLLAAVCAGCNVLGVAASAMPPPTVDAAYKGLANESVAVVVWAPQEIDLDFPALSQQVGMRLQSNLESARDAGGKRAKIRLEGATFPYPASSFVAYFKEDPTLAMMPTADFAPLTGARRVIYVEISEFTTHGGAASGLVRGAAEINLAVYEVENPVTLSAGQSPADSASASRGVEVYRDAAIQIAYPPDGPEEGSTQLDARQAYAGLIVEIADTIAKRFVPHQEEQ